MEILARIVKYLRGEVKKCTNHPDRDSVSFCHNCKKHFCNDCLVVGARFCYCRAATCMSACASEQDYSLNPRFCPQCIAASTDEACGNLLTVNFIGTRLIDETRRECPTCGSLELTLSSPIGMGASYKVIWLDENKERFISRKIRTSVTDSA